MACGVFKVLPRRTNSNKILRGNAVEIASHQQYDGYQGGISSMVYNFIDKKSKGSTARSGIGIISEDQ